MSPVPASLLFDDVGKTYGARTVVDGVTLLVQAGSIAALVGINGSGKSTLFRIAAGFVRASRGSVAIVDPIAGRTALEHEPPSRRTDAGLEYLSQDRLAFSRLSTLDNLRIAAPARTTDAIVADLRELRLTHLIEKRPGTMNAADLVLLLLAKACIVRPRFFLVDEPFAGLDRVGAVHCMAVLRKMRERGTGILLTDHSRAPLVAIADIIHIMQDGRLLYSDTVAAARASDEARRLYFGAHG